MPIFHAQVAAAGDSILPRDRFVNTLHFDRPVALPADPDAIAGDIADVFQTNWYVGLREITVKLYANGPPPQFPFGEATINAGLAPATPGPREVALCMSFYADNNLPRRRGRIYLPAYAGGMGGSVRPTNANMLKAMALGDLLSGIGGADIDWGVYSQMNGSFHRATIAYVDDEWDTQRSRGLRPTTRTLDAVSG